MINLPKGRSGTVIGIVLGAVAVCGFVGLLTVMVPRGLPNRPKTIAETTKTVAVYSTPYRYPSAEPATRAVTTQREVVVNGVRLNDATLFALARDYNMRIGDGTYWYDPYSGAWGYPNGPVQGFIMPGLRIGGRLRSDASGGGTNIYVNGRELHPADQYNLEQITGPLLAGRYWLDSMGNLSIENSTKHINLIALVRAAAQQSHDAQNPYQGPTRSSDQFYYQSGDCSVIAGEGVLCTGSTEGN